MIRIINVASFIRILNKLDLGKDSLRLSQVIMDHVNGNRSFDNLMPDMINTFADSAEGIFDPEGRKILIQSLVAAGAVKFVDEKLDIPKFSLFGITFAL